MGESQKALIAALVKAQAKFPSAERNAIGQSGGRKYPYATLDCAVETVRPILAEFGLGFNHEPRSCPDGGHEICGVVFHGESGEERCCTWKFSPDDLHGMHAIGSAITYMRRYLLLAMLGIAVSDAEDTDARESMQNRGQRRTDSNGSAGGGSGTGAPPAANLPDGADLIIDVTPKEGGKGPRWIVRTARGMECSTFRQEIAELAEQAMATETLVVLTTKRWTSGNASGFNLDDVQVWKPATQSTVPQEAPPAAAGQQTANAAPAAAAPAANRPPTQNAVRPQRVRLIPGVLEHVTVNGRDVWKGPGTAVEGGEESEYGIMDTQLRDQWAHSANFSDPIDVTWTPTKQGKRLVMRIDPLTPAEAQKVKDAMSQEPAW